MSVLNPKDYIPTVKSTDKDWETFYNALTTHFSKKDANDIWLKFWGQRGGAVDANTNELRQFMQGKGVSITADSVLGTLITGTDDLVSTIGDAVGGVFGIGKGIVIGACVITGLLIVGLGYRIYKTGVSANYGGVGAKI